MGASDEQLMLAYAAGDATAFDALYGRHKGSLFRFVLRSVKGRAEAEEIFQDVWMRAVEARRRYEPRAKFTTWLYTIAHNRIVDHWRAKGLTLTDGDDKLNKAYRELGAEEPGDALDQAIVAAAHRAVAPRSATQRWAVPVSVAAVLVLAVGVTLRMQQESPGIEVSPPPAVA